MHSFDSHSDNYTPFHLRGQELDRTGVADSEEVLQSAENGIRRLDSADISTIWWMHNGMKGSSNVSVMCNNNNLETASSSLTVEKGQLVLHNGGGGGGVGNSGVVADKNKEKDEVASGYNLDHSISGRGIGAFEADHARWQGEHQRLIGDLRSALSYNQNDKELNLLVGAVVSHYGELFQIKKAGARSDMFHILSGVWRTPAERCLMWLGGFRPSDLLKVVEKEIEAVISEEELVGICNLQQSCLQTEDSLSQGMDTLIHHSLFLTLSSPNLVNYANQMATAITNMEKIENFLNRADLLRLHTLQQLQRILTTHQAARALIAIDDYKSRLRALSSLWNNWANNVTLK